MVVAHYGAIVAARALIPSPAREREFACLAVGNDYRTRLRERLLAAQSAPARSVRRVFALTSMRALVPGAGFPPSE